MWNIQRYKGTVWKETMHLQFFSVEINTNKFPVEWRLKCEKCETETPQIPQEGNEKISFLFC